MFTPNSSLFAEKEEALVQVHDEEQEEDKEEDEEEECLLLPSCLRACYLSVIVVVPVAKS